MVVIGNPQPEQNGNSYIKARNQNGNLMISEGTQCEE
jgi:hypothetical protein